MISFRNHHSRCSVPCRLTVAGAVLALIGGVQAASAAHAELKPVPQDTPAVASQDNSWLSAANKGIRTAILVRDLAGAVQAADRALTVVGQHPPGSFDTDALLETYNLQAHAYQALGLQLSAAFTLRRALDIVDDYTYAQPERLLRQVRLLADAWKYANRPDEADAGYRRALAVTGGLPGPMQLEHAENLAAYARYLIDRLQFAAAEPLLIQAQRHLTFTPGADDVRLEKVMHLLQVAYLGLNLPDRALHYGWACVEKARLQSGAESAAYVRELFSYARIELRVGRQDSAGQHLAEARARAVALGMDDAFVARIEARMAGLPTGARLLAEAWQIPVPQDIQDTSTAAAARKISPE